MSDDPTSYPVSRFQASYLNAMNYLRQTRDRAKAFTWNEQEMSTPVHPIDVITVEKIPREYRPQFNRLLTFIIIAILAIIVLIVGLAVGLDRKGKNGTTTSPPPRPTLPVISSPPITQTSNVPWDVTLQHNSIPSGSTTFTAAAILAPNLFTQSTGAKSECGYRVNNDSPDVVRISYKAFDVATQQAGGAVLANRLCGMTLRAVTGSGESVDAKVVGRCPEGVCDDQASLGMSVRTYAQLVGKQAAVSGTQGNNVQVTWAWL